MKNAAQNHTRIARITAVSAITALGVFCGSAPAQVISGSQIVFPKITATEYDATVIQVPSPNGDFTSLVFNYTGTTLAVTVWVVDEESDWYLTNTGDTFSAVTIAAHQFPIIFTADNPRPPVSIPLGNFYLGVNTGISYDPNGNPTPGTSRNVFGWLELNNTGTELLPVANAVAYNEGGIIIGTTTPTPEPTTAALALLAALPLLLKRPNRP